MIFSRENIQMALKLPDCELWSKFRLNCDLEAVLCDVPVDYASAGTLLLAYA